MLLIVKSGMFMPVWNKVYNACNLKTEKEMCMFTGVNTGVSCLNFKIWPDTKLLLPTFIKTRFKQECRLS